MGLRINTNTQSLRAQKGLNESREKLESAQSKLASGLKINRAQDDAAGLAISENLRATRRSTAQNIKNAENGLLLLDTAEGGLKEISDLIIRMKELAIQASSGTNGDSERSYLDGEFQQLKAELDRISETTKFNGRPLLNGQGGNVVIQVGPNNVPGLDQIDVSTNFQVNTGALSISGTDLASLESAQSSLDPLGAAINVISGVRGNIGANASRLQSTINNLREYEINIAGSYSKIRDTDVAAETAELTKNSILTQAGVSILTQANTSPQLALKLLG